MRALLAHDRGDAAVLSRVRIPSVEEEDRKRLLRERRRLVKERTSLTNAVKGLLKLHGIFDLQPRAKGFEARFAEVRTAYGSTFPPRARQEILRLAERLSLVERQIAQVEAERDAIVRQGEALAVPPGARGKRCAGGGENGDADPVEGDRRERRDPADARDLLSRVPQPPGARELGWHNANPLGERGHATRPGDQP